MSSKAEPAIWSCATGSRYLVPTAVNLSITHYMDVRFQRCTSDNGATIIIFQGMGLGVQAYETTDTHVTTQSF